MSKKGLKHTRSGTSFVSGLVVVLFAIVFCCSYGVLSDNGTNLLPTDDMRLVSATPATEGTVDVIIDIGDGCLEDYDANEEPLSEFSSDAATENQREEMQVEQNAVQEKILALDENAEFVYSYTNLLNGFSAKVDADAISDILALPEVENVSGVGQVTVAEEPENTLPSLSLFSQNQSQSMKPMDTNSTNMMHTQKIWDVGYSGVGKTVAIFDTTLRHTHQLFSYVSDESRNAPGFLTKDDVMKNVLDHESSLNLFKAFDKKAQDEARNGAIYVSEKVPFAFDYADGDTKVNDSDSSSHGTHVAGIIAGNPGGSASLADAKGVAYDAQILFYKVFPTGASSVGDDVIIAAVEDAVILGADAFNLSLGSYYGAATYQSGVQSAYVKAFTTARKAGVNVACAAGNDGREEHSSVYYSDQLKYDRSEKDSRGFFGFADFIGYTKTQYPNAGSTISFPGAAGGATAVAAAINETMPTIETYRTTVELTSPEDEDQGWSVASLDDYNYIPFGNNEKVQDKDLIHIGGKDIDAVISSGLDVQGKIVLAMAKYGENSESILKRQQQLYNAGAVGSIFYVSRTNTETRFSLWDGERFPSLGFVSYAQGSKVADALDSGIHVVGNFSSRGITTDPSKSVANPKNNKNATYFSSWGVTEELNLKPEIMTPGQYIMSAGSVSDTAVALMTGTSMATPMYTGTLLLMQQYIDKNAAAFGLDQNAADYKLKRADLADEILASTAEPYEFTLAANDQEKGYISPRKQGAGLVRLDKAVATDTVLHNGAAFNEETGQSQRCKLELGDKLGKTFTMTYYVSNVSDSAKDYTTTAALQTEAAAASNGAYLQSYMQLITSDYLFLSSALANIYTLHQQTLNGTVIKVSDVQNGTLSNGGNNIYAFGNTEGATIRVPAHTTATITLTVTLPDMSNEEKEWPNGQFLEGYIFMKNDVQTYSIPYVGFYGDWLKSPSIDNGDVYHTYDNVAADDCPVYYNNSLRTVNANGKKSSVAMLGANQFCGVEFPRESSSVATNSYRIRNYSQSLRESNNLSADYVAFSPNGDGFADEVYGKIDLLRYVGTLKTQILDESGNVVRDLGTWTDIAPTSAYGNVPGMSQEDQPWDGRDNDGNEVANGTYIYRTIAYLSYDKEMKFPQTLDMKVRVDREAPTVNNVSVAEKDGKTIVQAKAADNHMLQAYAVFYNGEKIENSDTVLNQNAAEISYDISALAKKSDFDPGKISVQVVDYAMNMTEAKEGAGSDDTYISEKTYSAEEQARILKLQDTMREVCSFVIDPNGGIYPANGFTYGSEWFILGLNRSYVAIPQDVYEKYKTSAKAEILDTLEKNDYQYLNKTNRTENSRTIIGLGALNVDCTDLDGEGHSLLTGIENLTAVSKQGINGTMWALLALDSKSYPDPEDATATRDRLIDELLKQEIKADKSVFGIDGGWSLAEYNGPDSDLTGMAMVALAPYYQKDYVTSSERRVKDYVDRGLITLTKHTQDEHGTMGSLWGISPETTGWVIQACLAAGVDPVDYKDSAGNLGFVTDQGKNMFDGLLYYRFEDKGFIHSIGESRSNGITTEQGLYTLAAYMRSITGQTSLFDLSDADKKRDVTVSATDHGTVTVDLAAAAQGDTVTVTVAPEDGYVLDPGSLRYVQKEGNIRFDEEGHLVYEQIPASFAVTLEEKDGKAVFAMPKGAVTITASFVAPEDQGVAAVESLIENLPDPQKLQLSDETAIKAAREGYDALKDSQKELVSNRDRLFQIESAFADLKVAAVVIDKINAIGTVTENSGDIIAEVRAAYDALTDSQKQYVTNLAILSKAEETYAMLTTPVPFTDIENHWSKDAVKYAYQHKLFNGISETLFAPDLAMTRGMLVTVLYRMEGTPETTDACVFQDVPGDAYYYSAVVWANKNGIVNGISETEFAPDQNISREQIATMMMRYTKFKGFAVSKRSNLNKYADSGEISAWAKDALSWANAVKLINGRDNAMLAPKGNATRAEVATILMRLNHNILGID